MPFLFNPCSPCCEGTTDYSICMRDCTNHYLNPPSFFPSGSVTAYIYGTGDLGVLGSCSMPTGVTCCIIQNINPVRVSGIRVVGMGDGIDFSQKYTTGILTDTDESHCCGSQFHNETLWVPHESSVSPISLHVDIPHDGGDYSIPHCCGGGGIPQPNSCIRVGSLITSFDASLVWSAAHNCWVSPCMKAGTISEGCEGFILSISTFWVSFSYSICGTLLISMFGGVCGNPLSPGNPPIECPSSNCCDCGIGGLSNCISNNCTDTDGCGGGNGCFNLAIAPTSVNRDPYVSMGSVNTVVGGNCSLTSVPFISGVFSFTASD